MFKIIFFFALVNVVACNKTNEKFVLTSNSYNKKIISYSSTYLTANYSISKGDAYTASKILQNNEKNTKLLELKFFANLVSGDFVNANKTANFLNSSYRKNQLYNLPKFILNIKENNFKDLLNPENQEKNNYNQSSIITLIKFWYKLYNNFQKINIDQFSEENSIHKLLILENFFNPEDLIDIADNLYKSGNLNYNDALLLAGYYYRLNDISKFKEIINKQLSDQFDKAFIINSFSSSYNIYYNVPNLQTILAAKIYNNAIARSKNIENSLTHQKILLEMSLFLCPELDISKYALSEIYNFEKTDTISLNKLNSISENSFFFLASILKKLSIIKSQGNISEYYKILFRNYKKWPNNKLIVYKLANYFKSIGKYHKASKLYEGLMNTEVPNNRLLFLYASTLDKTGKWNESKGILLKILEKNPEDTYTLNYISYKLALREEELDFALKLIKKALVIDPNNGFFLDTLGWIEFKRKNYNSSVFFLEKSVSLLPNSSEVIDHLGDCYLMLNRKNEAIFEWKKALNYEKDNKVIKSIQKKLSKYE